MKTALWILGSFLVLDILFLSYFYVFRVSYYFPDRYEVAFGATVEALLFGLPVAGAFIALLLVSLLQRKNSKTVKS